MSIYQKLLSIQNELKAPKSQYNKFGEFSYRNCEDILEAAKPLNKKYGVTLILTDSVDMIGERFYVKSTAILVDTETGEKIEVSASAREEESKPKMDGSQVTGSASSYARKYALNGLYNIDDNKDSDNQTKPLSPREALAAELKARGISTRDFAAKHQMSKDTTEEEYAKLLEEIRKEG